MYLLLLVAQIFFQCSVSIEELIIISLLNGLDRVAKQRWGGDEDEYLILIEFIDFYSLNWLLVLISFLQWLFSFQYQSLLVFFISIRE